MDWIDKLNKELQERRERNSTPEAKEAAKKRMYQYGGSISSPSKEARKKLSELKKKTKFTESHKKALKKSKLKYKITKKQILDVQSKYEFVNQMAKELGITVNTFKSIAKFHGVYKSHKMEDMGRINGMKTAKPIKVWKWNKEEKCKGDFIGEFESCVEANRHLGTTGSALRYVADGKYNQAKGYYAEWVIKSIF